MPAWDHLEGPRVTGRLAPPLENPRIIYSWGHWLVVVNSDSSNDSDWWPHVPLSLLDTKGSLS